MQVYSGLSGHAGRDQVVWSQIEWSPVRRRSIRKAQDEWQSRCDCETNEQIDSDTSPVRTSNALLVQCVNTKIQFWMQCMRPEVLLPHVRRLDNEILQVARIATGQPFANGNELGTIRLRWPRRLLGGMLRSAADVAPAAYLVGICLCVPSFTAWTDATGNSFPGLLDHMQDVFGKGSFDVGKDLAPSSKVDAH